MNEIRYALRTLAHQPLDGTALTIVGADARRRHAFHALHAGRAVAVMAAALARGGSRHPRELGIRMALGADRTAVVALILGAAFRLVAIGLAIGTACALPAAYRPARRASRLEPLAVLRME